MTKTEAPQTPKEWNLERMLAAIKEAAPKLETVTIEELRRRAAKRELPKMPDVDSLQAALGRIVEAIRGKPIGAQKVLVGHFRDGSPRYGSKEYAAHVAVRDLLAVGLFLDSKSAHDDRTKTIYNGALNAKWGEDGAPHYVQALVADILHMLQAAALAGA